MKPSEKRTSKGLWWDRAWSLVDGCTPVSEGCAHCWSASMARRFGRDFSAVTPRWDRLELPLKVRRPTVWAVWNDLFHEQVSTSFIDAALEMMMNCPQHLFLVLTKRAHLIGQKLYGVTKDRPLRALGGGDYVPNLWLGVTAENQRHADERIPLLLRIPAAKRFVSVEPMLGRVDLTRWLACRRVTTPAGWKRNGDRNPLDLVIVGAETGPGKRPMDLQWARDLWKQCQNADVPFWFKQGPGGEKTLDGKVVREWPE